MKDLASIDWQAPWARLLLWFVSRVPFAALPLLLNLFVWLLVRGMVAWHPFQVEDLCYFSILLASETLLGLVEHLRVESKRSLIPFCLLVLVGFASAGLLGFWHHEQAAPRADGPYREEPQRVLAVAAALAVCTLVVGATTQVALPRHQPIGVLRFGFWLAGRIGSAHLPLLFSAFFWTLTSTPYVVLRVNDLSFLAIALAGPALIDLIVDTVHPKTPQILTAAPLLLVTICASLVLGCWYFTSALPPVPGIKGDLADNLRLAAGVVAVASIAVAVFVQLQAEPDTKPKGQEGV